MKCKQCGYDMDDAKAAHYKRVCRKCGFDHSSRKPKRTKMIEVEVDDDDFSE